MTAKWQNRATLVIAVLFLAAAGSMTVWRLMRKSHPGSIPWQTDVKAATTEARHSGKRLLLDFSATWCGPCQMMADEVWPDGDVAHAVAEHYVPVAIDIDSDAGATLARQYDINAVPTIMVLDDNGKVLRQAHGMDVDTLLQFLRK